MKKIYLIVLLCSLYPSYFNAANASTITAQSCSYNDVSVALDMAQKNDHIKIPAGVCDWLNNSLVIKKQISIEGDGAQRTVLERTQANIPDLPLIIFECSEDNLSPSVSGIKFSGMADTSQRDRGLALVHGCQDFTISNNVFTGFANTAIEISDYTDRNPNQRGVIFENQFIENFRVGLGYGISVAAGGRDHSAIEFGDENFIFIEDNYFAKNRHSVASNLGAKYVLRNNTIVDNYPNYSAVDTHGKTHSDDRSGTKGVEIYDNLIHQSEDIDFLHDTPDNPGFTGIGLRGGEALIYSNEIRNYRFPITLLIESSQPCSSLTRPIEGQPDNVYIWNNVLIGIYNTPVTDISLGGNDDCTNMFAENEDYFFVPKPMYIAFQYPHPLRAIRDENDFILELLPTILSGSIRGRNEK